MSNSIFKSKPVRTIMRWVIFILMLIIAIFLRENFSTISVFEKTTLAILLAACFAIAYYLKKTEYDGLTEKEIEEIEEKIERKEKERIQRRFELMLFIIVAAVSVYLIIIILKIFR